jgi:hypothetical protein
VTLNQLDELHQRPEGSFRKLFIKNKKRLTNKEHYFELKGEELKEFKEKHSEIAKSNRLYLISENGYFNLTKTLSDDVAWLLWRHVVEVSTGNKIDTYKNLFQFTEEYLSDIELIDLENFIKVEDIDKINTGGLYAFFDNENVVYIGKAINIRNRYLGHKNNSNWFDDSFEIRYAECKNWYQNELNLIRKYQPFGNINGNPARSRSE